MNITILDDYQNYVPTLNCFTLLNGLDITILNRSEKNTQKLAELLYDTEILVLIRERTSITEELLSLLPNLKLISQTGKISNHLDLNACTKYKVLVSEGIGSPIAPAELTWALIMNAVRQIPASIEAMKQGEWQSTIGSVIHGKNIGIWGYGKIGKKIAQYGKVFGAKISVWGSHESMEKAQLDGFNKANSKAEFFSDADIITLHLRLNEKTKGIVKEADLMRMKADALFVNTARAELIEKGILLQCLKKGRPGYAALDVYEDEPIYGNSEFLTMPNVLCTPHLGYVEKNSYEMYFKSAFENIVQFANGTPTNIVNSELLPNI